MLIILPVAPPTSELRQTLCVVRCTSRTYVSIYALSQQHLAHVATLSPSVHGDADANADLDDLEVAAMLADRLQT